MSEKSSTDKIFSGSTDSFACGMRSVRDMRSTVDEKKKEKRKNRAMQSLQPSRDTIEKLPA